MRLSMKELVASQDESTTVHLHGSMMALFLKSIFAQSIQFI